MQGGGGGPCYEGNLGRQRGGFRTVWLGYLGNWVSGYVGETGRGSLRVSQAGTALELPGASLLEGAEMVESRPDFATGE